MFFCLASLGVSLANLNMAAGITSACLFAFLTSSFLMSLLSIRKIDLWRSPSSDCHAGNLTELPVTVRNRGKFLRQAFVVGEKLPFTGEPMSSFVVEPLAPGEKRLIKRELNAVKRGFYKMDRIFLIGGDPAGLFRRVKTFRIPEEITVYPGICRIPWMPIYIKNKIQDRKSVV